MLDRTGRAYRYHGRIPLGEACHSAKLTGEIVAACRIRAAGGETITSLAREFGVHPNAMWQAIRGKTWKHVEQPA